MSDSGVVTGRREFEAPLTIGVISDTHIYPGGRREMPPECLSLFRRFDCGLIVHAGDANTVHTLRALAEIAPVLAVAGNIDDLEYRAVAPEEIPFTVGRFRFGLLHGNGNGTARQVAKHRFAGVVDLCVYGHSHIPMIEREEGTIFFNPGSAADRRWSDYFGVGIITVDDVRISPELILFKDPRELQGINPD